MTAFLELHQVQPDYRAKMVDWMLEVLTTFKNSDQTYFLAINILDRYFKLKQSSLPASELHLSGILSMFIASKYEDIVPLMMKTVVNKIGHNKFELPTIQLKELEMLQTLGYKIGQPTVKEFIDRMLEQMSEYLPKSDLLSKQLLCLAKMTCFSYELQQLPTSLLAAGILLLALRQGLIAQSKISSSAFELLIAEMSEQSLQSINAVAASIFDMAKNYETEYANTRNLKLVYADVLKTIRFFGNNNAVFSPKQSLTLPSI